MFCYIFRTIANYIVWSIMQNRVNNLPRRFLEARDDYVMVLCLSHNASRFFLPRQNHSYHITVLPARSDSDLIFVYKIIRVLESTDPCVIILSAG